MNLIACGENCLHQKDGYCNLDKPTLVTDPQAVEKKGCLYYTSHPEESPSAPKVENLYGL